MTVDEKIGSKVAVVTASEIVLKDTDSAMDLISQMWSLDCNGILIDKENIAEEFFDLSTKIAGDVLQKCTNYHIRIAIVGDFSGYKSKSLQDFIFESNKGRHVLFLTDKQQALERLHG